VRDLASRLHTPGGNVSGALHYMEKARAIAAAAEPPGLPDAALCSMFVSLSVYRLQLGMLAAETAHAGPQQQQQKQEEEATVAAFLAMPLDAQALVLTDLRRAVEMATTAGDKAQDRCPATASAFLSTLVPVSLHVLYFSCSECVHACACAVCCVRVLQELVGWGCRSAGNCGRLHAYACECESTE
jgi:hypothetical protein